MNKFLRIFALLSMVGFSSLTIYGNETDNDTDSDKIKNVILIIGDGMGPAQVGLLEAYARQSKTPVLKTRTTAFKRMMNEGGVLGVSMTYAANVLVTDSAASATQLAIGKPAKPETIGVDSQGYPRESVLVIAKKMGKATGLVSDVRITHSTPAAFAAHQPHRSLENEIALDMLATGPDVMLSGGLRHWIPEQANDHSSAIYKQLSQMTDGAINFNSKRSDERNLLSEAQQQGYQLAFTNKQMQKANAKETEKLLGLFTNSAFPDAIITDRDRNNPERTIPTLKEMTSKAIGILDNNDQGFFLMIESGLIDWAAHYNDTGTMLHEMLKMNETLNYVLDWANGRDDTLIVVTADHETGGFGFSYSGADIPEPEDLPGSVFKNRSYTTNFNFGPTNVLDKIYQQKLSYTEIFSRKFDQLNAEQKTPAALMAIINQNTEFDITEQQAARILETEDNPYYVQGHKSLSARRVPRIDANDAFFVYHLDDNRQNLLAIEVATRQSVVWSNGTHTASPVLVFAKGNEQVTAPFVQFMGHPELGQKIIKIMTDQK
ncbi:MAG: alkaline phosphatase [Gammaproteobacteria bacterium]|nr:alkaline phosphatase [Gammaproteobacteria bacterium]